MTTQSNWSNGLRHSTQSLTADGNTGPTHTTQLSQETVDLIQWTNAQGLAMSKLKIFQTMAKQINDQA
jgi:hypothetical protein